MIHNKLAISMFLSLSIGFGLGTTAHAQDKVEDVSVFYKNEAGKKLVLQKAEQVDAQLNEIDAVVGEFSKADLEKLEQSKDIHVVHSGKKKLRTLSTFLANPLSAYQSSWNLDMVRADEAWNQKLDGQGVKVGIIDSAVAPSNYLINVKKKDFISDRSQIDHSLYAATHGTFVAGIIAGQPSKSGELVGVAPGADLYSMNIDGKDGADLIDFMEAIDYAIEMKLDVLNISMGISQGDLLDPGEKLADSPIYIAVKKALDRNILIVAATGNYGNSVDYPAAINGVVAVGSVDSKKAISSFSNQGKEVSVVAPGSYIKSLGTSNNFESKSGTSFATPHIAGLLALYKQQYPKESNAQIRARLLSNTIDLGASGFDSTFGNGLAVYPKNNNSVDYPVVLPDKKPVVKPKVETAAEKYVRVNKKKITTSVATMNKKKKVNFLTEYAPMYSVYGNLAASQKKIVLAYRKQIGMTVVSSTAKSSRVKVTNLTSIHTKKTSRLTFTTPLKKSTVKRGAVTMYKDGTKFNSFNMTVTTNGKYVTIRPTKAMTKGTYHLVIDPAKMRTTKNKTVKPFDIKYTVK
ncbi:S8 family serine peptidase [Kurthia gibsonii]|uniref:S8 family serine peptidase n=1 Tax=Kurthia gibsonii TaxID=33946 RepID=UPI003F259011